MADRTKIFNLHYRGSRFRDARIPVEVLSDLPAFRDLLVSFAKDEWRRRHTDRQRVPKGFDKSLSFDLISIQRGSAIPQLEWNRASAQINLPGFVDEIEDVVDVAYNGIVQLIGGSDDLRSDIDSEKIRALNRFGAGLRDGEQIELAGSVDGKIVQFTNYRRKQLITGMRETYRKRYEGSGELIGISIPDERQGYLTVRTREYGQILIPSDPTQVRSEFASQLSSNLQFEILVELDSQDRFRSVVDVYDVASISDDASPALKRCLERLEELRTLPQGWSDGTGRRISSASLENANSLLNARSFFCDAYRIYPTEVGGILVDLVANGWDISIEFNPTGNVELYAIGIDNDYEIAPIEFSDFAQFLAEFDRRASLHD